MDEFEFHKEYKYTPNLKDDSIDDDDFDLVETESQVSKYFSRSSTPLSFEDEDDDDIKELFEVGQTYYDSQFDFKYKNCVENFIIAYSDFYSMINIFKEFSGEATIQIFDDHIIAQTNLADVSIIYHLPILKNNITTIRTINIPIMEISKFLFQC